MLDTSDYEDNLDDASKKTNDFADKLKKGLATAAKVGAAAIGAASAAVGALTKQSIEGYAEYEQLVGGVETLFKGSADTVMEYANNAYKTAGLSANQYMETVTSFSASLLQSLGDDTQAAAEVADLAITDMADNANKMGSSMESIQNAYQGFAKQNYTMLDNLKLGYGGTKEEMARLIEDAAKIKGLYGADAAIYANKGVNGDLSIIIDAIHTVQTEIGITGTTAAEAASTIEGSVAAAKSAWSNLVTGIADENADLGILIDNFVDSAATAAENIIPRVEKFITGIGDLAIKLAPVIEEKLPQLMDAILPSLISAATALVVALASAIPNMLPVLVDAALKVVDEIGNGLAEKIPFLSGLFENLEVVVTAAAAAFVAYKTASAISGVIEALTKATEAQSIAQAALNAVMKANPFVLVATLIAAVGTALVTLYMTNEDFRNKVNAIWSKIKETISGVVNSVVTFFTKTIPDAGQKMIDFFKSVPKMALTWGKDLIDNFVNGIKNKISAVKDAVSNVATTVKNFLGFSEPEEGPLSNFHTYAPDMMKLFAQGIAENVGIVQKQLDKSLNFDFGTANVDFAASASGMAYSRNGGTAAGAGGGNALPITIIVQSVLDGKVIGETAYTYAQNRQRAYGGA